MVSKEDKEAQEKIEQILILRIKSLLMWGHNSTEEQYEHDFDDCVQYHLKQLKEEIYYELGYRKLPKDKPPLLSDEEIEDAFKGKAIFASSPEMERLAEASLIAQAQWDVWNEWYEGRD